MVLQICCYLSDAKSVRILCIFLYYDLIYLLHFWNHLFVDYVLRYAIYAVIYFLMSLSYIIEFDRIVHLKGTWILMFDVWNRTSYIEWYVKRYFDFWLYVNCSYDFSICILQLTAFMDLINPASTSLQDDFLFLIDLNVL